MLLAGKMLNREDFTQAAVDSAVVLCEEFDWHTKPQGRLTISYFTDSHDEVINIGSDVAILLAELIAAGHDEKGQFSESLAGLIRMINAEQESSGRWIYVTRDFLPQAKSSGVADCHHSAQVVSGLLRVLEADVLEKGLADETQHTAAKGLEYHCKAFFRPNGFALNMDNGGIREASITGYGEGVVCMCDALESDCVSVKIKTELDLENLARTVLETAVRRFVSFRSWDVASYRFGPWRTQLRSIRWGSGVLMEAISHFLAFEAEQGRDE